MARLLRATTSKRVRAGWSTSPRRKSAEISSECGDLRLPTCGDQGDAPPQALGLV